jgi:Uma2 family endonuclease
MAEATQTRITAAEFAQLPETNIPTELIHGEVIVSPTPKDTHQTLVYRLAKLVEQLSMGRGEVRISPLDVYLDEHNVVQPDVFWVSGGESRCQLGTDDYWHGAPDLVIEVLSPGTARRDRGEKFQLYEEHGVRGYWLVDPDAAYVEVWQQAENRFHRVGVFGPEGSFTSAVLGGEPVGLKQVLRP